MLRVLDAAAVINLIAPQRAQDVSSENQRLRSFMPMVRLPECVAREPRGLFKVSRG